MKKIEKEFVCISCPMGCMLTVIDDNQNIEVKGNTCKLGLKYGINEYKNPLRTITTSIEMIKGSKIEMVSVKTSKEVPKTDMFNCLEEIKKLKLEERTIEVGDVLIKNILNLDVDIIATRKVI